MFNDVLNEIVYIYLYKVIAREAFKIQLPELFMMLLRDNVRTKFSTRYFFGEPVLPFLGHFQGEKSRIWKADIPRSPSTEI